MADGMIVRHGVHAPLEAAADEMLRQSLKGVTKHSEKADILTPWKEQARRRREIFTTGGTPDRALREGNFHRTANFAAPHLNSVDSVAAKPRRISSAGAHWDAE